MGTVRVAWAALLLCVCVSARVFRLNQVFAELDRPHARRLEGNQVIVDSSQENEFGHARLAYNATMRRDSFSLDDIDSNKCKARCSLTTISWLCQTATEATELTNLMHSLALVHASDSFCSQGTANDTLDNVQDLPLYRKITTVTLLDAKSVVLETNETVFSSFFDYLALHVEFTPTDRPERLRRIYEIDYEKSWDLLSFNYDKTTKSAATAKQYFDQYKMSYCNNCYAHISLGFRLVAIFSGMSLDTFHFTIFGEAEARAEVVLGGTISPTSPYEIDIGKPIPVSPLTFFVLGLPIWITPSGQLKGRVTPSFEVSVKASAGFQFSARVELGVQYTKQSGWGFIGSKDWSFDTIGPTFQFDVAPLPAHSFVDFFAIPEVILSLYSFIPFVVQPLPYVRLNFDRGVLSDTAYVFNSFDSGITVPALTRITSPAPGSIFYIGEPLVVAWAYENIPASATVDIELWSPWFDGSIAGGYKPVFNDISVAASPYSGCYSNDWATASDTKIKITPKTFGGKLKSEEFNIQSPTLSISSPYASVNWAPESRQTLRWNSRGLCSSCSPSASSFFKIFLYRDVSFAPDPGHLITTVSCGTKSDTGAQGALTWDVACQPDIYGDGWYFWFRDENDKDLSTDQVEFSIGSSSARKVTVSRPWSGIVLEAGSVQQISWSMSRICKSDRLKITLRYALAGWPDTEYAVIATGVSGSLTTYTWDNVFCGPDGYGGNWFLNFYDSYENDLGQSPHFTINPQGGSATRAVSFSAVGTLAIRSWHTVYWTTTGMCSQDMCNIYLYHDEWGTDPQWATVATNVRCMDGHVSWTVQSATVSSNVYFWMFFTANNKGMGESNRFSLSSYRRLENAEDASLTSTDTDSDALRSQTDSHILSVSQQNVDDALTDVANLIDSQVSFERAPAVARDLELGDCTGAVTFSLSYGLGIGAAIGAITVPDAVPVCGGWELYSGYDFGQKSIIDTKPFATLGSSGCLSSCSDGQHNGDETAADCGGSCETCAYCAPDSCNNHGSCFVSRNQIVCVCVPQFYGSADCGIAQPPECNEMCSYSNACRWDAAGSASVCVQTTCNPPCAQGTCQWNDEAFDMLCSCYDGFTGNDCSAVTPTCDDNMLNGVEVGVDCGGDCEACGSTQSSASRSASESSVSSVANLVEAIKTSPKVQAITGGAAAVTLLVFGLSVFACRRRIRMRANNVPTHSVVTQPATSPNNIFDVAGAGAVSQINTAWNIPSPNSDARV